MALAHHDAAQGHQGRRGEAKLFGPEKRGDRHVPAGFQLAVGLQHHARAQVVHHQRVMGFHHPEFPGEACVLDGGEGRCPGAAIMARDHQVIGLRLCHPRGHGSAANLRAQLHADARRGVGVLEVVDELRHVLDGINIVVRRRADEAHAGGGVAHGGDDLVDLTPGQFAPFPGLSALDDLDL